MYFLPVSLRHTIGAGSSSHMHTVQGTVYSTHRETCGRLGLQSDDDEWRRAALDSFTSFFVPLSNVFGTIIAHCFPIDSMQLYDASHQVLLQYIRDRFRGRTALDSNEEASSYEVCRTKQDFSMMLLVSLEEILLPAALRCLIQMEIE